MGKAPDPKYPVSGTNAGSSPNRKHFLIPHFPKIVNHNTGIYTKYKNRYYCYKEDLYCVIRYEYHKDGRLTTTTIAENVNWSDNLLEICLIHEDL